MKKKLSTILLVLLFLIGLAFLLYPTVSDYWNSFHQSQAIASYAQVVAELEEDRYETLWTDAELYNQNLYQSSHSLNLTENERDVYEKQLDVSGTGIMGYIEIPTIGCSLPIYHGTNEAVLQIAVGHIEGSSLPTGGANTHCVLSAHRGLPSAKLFTDLDKMESGDRFTIHILDETLTYEVDQILVVLPYEVDSLKIEEGKDYCTLTTCTPYGVNSHRILVRGHRVENDEEPKVLHVNADAMQIDPLVVAPVVAAPMLLVLLLIMLRPKSVRKL